MLQFVASELPSYKLDALMQSEIAVGFVRSLDNISPRLRWTPVLREQLVVLIRNDNPQARGPAVKLRDVTDEPRDSKAELL